MPRNSQITSTFPARSEVGRDLKKLGLNQALCSVLLLLAATAVVSPAQTFTNLLTFDGTNGANPAYVYLVQGTDGNLYGTTFGGGANNGGTVFQLTTSGKLTTLYNFCSQPACMDGSAVEAGLVLSTDGFFYGTTTGGGTGKNGTVYKISTGGTLTTLHNFDGTDGGGPYVGLIRATNGNFYGTTSGGGTDDYGTIFEITPAGTLTSLHSFSGPDGEYPTSRLVQGTNGIFYGATTMGWVFEITAAGKLTTLLNTTEGSSPTGALIQAANGNFYGTAAGGGANGYGIVFEMTPAGKFTTLYNFCSLAGCADGKTPFAGLIQATDGNLYGTTAAGGGNYEGTIFQITTAGTLTTLYSFCSQAGCADGSFPTEGLVQATNGTFYGTTDSGGSDELGTLFSLSMGLGPFVETLPTSGKVGGKVIILGTNLAGTTSVRFNRTVAAFTVVSPSEIATTVPAGATSGRVKVITPGGTLSGNVVFRVTPQLLSFNPPSGPVGTSVVITGVSLTQANGVAFGGVAATSVSVNSDTQITATVPTGAKTGKISITTSGGTATSTGTFTVTP